MAAPPGYRPVRVLLMLSLLVVALVAWAFWPGQTHTPKLGLDLQGGTQVILAPTPLEEGASLTKEQLDQTVEIIRQRVNGVGVAEAGVAVQGTGNDAVVVVSVPGVTQDRIVDLVGQTALLNFRIVYGSQPGDIFLTIKQGRPNGMPSFQGLPNEVIWQLTAYVSSLSANRK